MIPRREIKQSNWIEIFDGLSLDTDKSGRRFQECKCNCQNEGNSQQNGEVRPFVKLLSAILHFS